MNDCIIWILTSDTTPKKNDLYLGAIQGGQHKQRKTISAWWETDHFVDSLGFKVDVYAWAPWPTPPEVTDEKKV